MSAHAGHGSATEVAIDSIAAGGDGVGRREGLVVFVPRTAPGDVARVRFAARGRFARGQLVDLARPSPDRVEPPCAHYVRDRCGGCQLQHIAYEAQLAAKAGIVHDSLTRIGRIAVERPQVEASEREWRYRRKLTLAIRGRRDARVAGLHPYDAPGRVFQLADCPITDERVVAVWRAIFPHLRLLPDGPELRAAVRLVGDGASLVVEGGTRWPEARRFFEAVPAITALWWVPEGRERRLLAERGGPAEPGASFAQVNVAVADRLHAYVVERLLRSSPATVVDAYSGSGDTAVAMAERGVRVTAIELDADATAWCAARLPAGSRAVAARVEDALPDTLPSDAVLVNPPRAGLHERVTAVLAAAVARPDRPRVLVYVSCNPATLARDLARMPEWRVTRLRSFDMFPQTAHVETVCELEPEAA